jgi:nucleotide-binding universal stress UspA family protein
MKVLIAADGSEPSLAAARFLAALPWPAETHVRVAAVVGQYGGDAYWGWEVLDEVKRGEWHWADQAIAATHDALKALPVEITAETREGEPAHQILEAAREFEADLVVLGSHGWTGVDAFLLGSVARNVAKHAHCSTMVARAPAHGLRRVVLAVDESEHSAAAARFVVQLPLPPDSEVTVASVVRPFIPYHGLVPTEPIHLEQIAQDAREAGLKQAGQLVDRVQSQLGGSGRPVQTQVREGDPAGQILQLASEEWADLIVAGARGISRIQAMLVGSVADRLLKTATCSVLLVR